MENLNLEKFAFFESIRCYQIKERETPWNQKN